MYLRRQEVILLCYIRALASRSDLARVQMFIRISELTLLDALWMRCVIDDHIWSHCWRKWNFKSSTTGEREQKDSSADQ